MPQAKANGQQLYYEIHGEGEPLLCIMGLATDISGWRFQLPAFSARFRTVVFDNRDVGRSSYADAPYEIADMAADAMALADELELERFKLLGVSLGGAIAQELALAAPERVESLTLAVTWGGGGRWERERARIHAATFQRQSERERFEDLLLLVLSEQAFETPEQITMLLELMMTYPYRQRPEGFLRQLEAGSRHDARDRLGDLRLPVHVIGAEHDRLVPVWKSRELAELIPDARLSILERAAHALNVERVPEFNELVLAFL
jgi:3-oxoadipate enol-lactonase